MSEWEEDLPIPSYDFDIRRAREIIDARSVMLMFLSPELFSAWDKPTSDSPDIHLTAWWQCKSPYARAYGNDLADYTEPEDYIFTPDMMYYTLSPDKPNVIQPHGVRCQDRYGYVHEGDCDYKFLGYVLFRYTPQWHISFVYSYNPRRDWVDRMSPEGAVEIDYPSGVYIKRGCDLNVRP